MSKTASEIQGDVYELLRESDFARMLTGGVYRAGFRPRDSKLEDAVVIFTTGMVGDIESGVVTINVFCPDVDPYGNGVLVCDGERIAALEGGAARWVESLTADKSNYLFRLKETIHTTEDPDINQHFVVVKLAYKYQSTN